VNFTDGQIAELSDAVGLDALGKDPLQRVADADLRRLDLTPRVRALGQGQDRFPCRGLDTFVADSPIVIQSDPPLASLGSRLLLRLRDAPHAQFPPCSPNRDPSPL
jgi:hypothetical protein